MTRLIRMSLVFIAALGGCGRKDDKTSAPDVSAPPPGPTAINQRSVGSFNYYLELAALHERYLDPTTAIEDLGHAVALATSPEEVVHAYAGLGRLKQSIGDQDGAVTAYEKALAETEALKQVVPEGSASGPGPGPMSMMAGGLPTDDLILRLGELYAQRQQFDKAEAIYAGAAGSTQDPYRREQLIQAQVQLFREAGTLDARVAERERALSDAKPDEAALRFLAVAYGGGATTSPGADPGAAPGGSGAMLADAKTPANADKLVQVYEKLRQLHGDDQQIRQALGSAYERAGRLEDALALIRVAPPQNTVGPGPLPPGQPQCPPNLIAGRAPTGPLLIAEQSVRLLMRNRRFDQALAEAATLASNSTAAGVPATVLASRLYVDLGKPLEAKQLLAGAAKAARSLEDKRDVEAARANVLTAMRKKDELTRLYLDWKGSADPCLRAEAEQWEKMHAAAGSAGASPPGP